MREVQEDKAVTPSLREGGKDEVLDAATLSKPLATRHTLDACRGQLHSPATAAGFYFSFTKRQIKRTLSSSET